MTKIAFLVKVVHVFACNVSTCLWHLQLTYHGTCVFAVFVYALFWCKNLDTVFVVHLYAVLYTVVDV